MTNCPNCGAPYKLGIPVCEYCGTPREKSPDEIRIARELEQAREDVERAKQNLFLSQLEQKGRYNINACNGSVIINSIIGNGNSIKSIQTMCKTVTPDLSQQAACGAQALANAASNNTCSFEQMRLNAMQAQFTAAECEQTARLMQNAFPHVEPPPAMEPKKRSASAMPLLFAVNVFLLLLLTAFTVIAGVLCALYGAGFLQKAMLIVLISVGYTVNLRTLIRTYKGGLT